MHFPWACGFPATARLSDHNMPRSARNGPICLECAAIFPHLPVSGTVVASGIDKSDDDQTHSDDWYGRSSEHGGTFGRAGAAGLSRLARDRLFDRSSGLSRISAPTERARF